MCKTLGEKMTTEALQRTMDVIKLQMTSRERERARQAVKTGSFGKLAAPPQDLCRIRGNRVRNGHKSLRVERELQGNGSLVDKHAMIRV